VFAWQCGQKIFSSLISLFLSRRSLGELGMANVAFTPFWPEEVGYRISATVGKPEPTPSAFVGQ
jgi:hypothetical protein